MVLGDGYRGSSQTGKVNWISRRLKFLPFTVAAFYSSWMGASFELVFTLQCCCLNHSVYCNTSCFCDACPLPPIFLSPTAQSLALLFEHPMCVDWCFLSNWQLGKSLFIREGRRATVYYLDITFLLAGTWTTAAKPGCSHPKICKLAWNEYFSVMNTDELNNEVLFTSNSCNWISWRLQF